MNDYIHRAMLVCSFCKKERREVQLLIAGVTAYICDECVEIAATAVAEHRAVHPPPTRPDPPSRENVDLTMLAGGVHDEQPPQPVAQTVTSQTRSDDAGLEALLDAHSTRVRDSMERALQAFRPRATTWRDVAGAVEAAIPTFVGSFSERSTQRLAATDFLLRFKDHAEKQGSEAYDDGDTFTIRGASLLDLFRYQLAFFDADVATIEAVQGEKKRVTGNLAAILSTLRKTPDAQVVFEDREYVAFLSIPEVGSGRGLHTYDVSMRVLAGRLFDNAATQIFALERRYFYKIFEDHWFDEALAWPRVGDALGAWLRLALRAYDPERVIFVLCELMRTMSLSDRVMFLNGLTGFDVHPLLVHEETFSADYMLAAWRNCSGDIHYLEDDALSILRKVQNHEGLDVLERAIALRILGKYGPDEFAVFRPTSRYPTVSEADQDLIRTVSAEDVCARRMNLREWMEDAEGWLKE